MDFGYAMDSLWISYGSLMDLIRIPCGPHVDSLWTMDSYGFLPDLLWIPYGSPIDSLWATDLIWIPEGSSRSLLDIFWIVHGFLLDVLWTPYGFLVDLV